MKIFTLKKINMKKEGKVIVLHLNDRVTEFKKINSYEIVENHVHLFLEAKLVGIIPTNAGFIIKFEWNND